MAKIHMVSPPVYVYDAQGGAHTVFGWSEADYNGVLEPIVGNPDGPGIGPWTLYHGQDPWTAH